MQKTFVYAPAVIAKVLLRDGTVLDISEDIVNGSVQRNIDSHSTASLTLANKGRKYERVFQPMDRIVISATKNGVYPLFAGYIDSAPYLAAWEENVTLTASCTIKRLEKLFWDAGLWSSQVLLTQSGTELQAPDSGIANSAIEVLREVAHWPVEQIHIAEIPEAFVDFASKVYDTLNQTLQTESDEAKQAFKKLIGAWGGGVLADSVTEGVPSGIPDKFKMKIEELAKQYQLPAAFICAVAKGESGWREDATNANTNGTGDYGMMQINSTHKEQYPEYFPPNDGWKDGNKSLEIGAKMLAGHYRWAKKKYPNDTLEQQLHTTYAAYNGGQGNFSDVRPQNNATRIIGFYREYIAEAHDKAANALDGQDVMGLGTKLPEPNVSSQGVPKYGSNAPSAVLYEIYGKTEAEVQKQLMKIDFVGKSIWVHRLAAGAFQNVSNAIKQTAEYGTYKITSIGTFNWRMTKPYGTSRSRHSWGIAVDINPGTNPQSKPLRYDIPDSWVKAFEENGFTWGGRWKKLPDSMHFQYEGGVGGEYQGSAGGSYGGTASGQGTNTLETIFWALNQFPVATVESALLLGKRSLINDKPVWGDILSLLNSSQRSVCSAPDGSLIAWFPDKFGIYGRTPYLTISDVELEDISVTISDDQLTTHVFAAGTALAGIQQLSLIDWQKTNGIISIEDLYPFLENWIVVPDGEKERYSPEALYMRYGARPLVLREDGISRAHSDSKVPFMFALFRFMEKWSQQFECQATMTFMPELFPGTRVRFESTGIEMYVESVQHQFDYQSGFRTMPMLSCPVSTSDKNGGMLKSVTAAGGEPYMLGDVVIQDPSTVVDNTTVEAD